MTVTVDTKKFKIPKAVAADINNYNSSAKDRFPKQSKKGKIMLAFSNYKINKGIPDSIFKENKADYFCSEGITPRIVLDGDSNEDM